MLTKQFEIFRKTRQYLLDMISGLTIEQLNKVPDGFNNNIAWNVSHLIASQQGVCYFRGSLPLIVTEDFFLSYKPDTKPNGFITAEQFDKTKKLLFSTIDKMEADYNNGVFNNNPAWTNRYGVEHRTIEDSINFLLFHDGLHLGYVMALKRVITK